MNDGHDGTHGEREFVAERDVDQDAEHRQERGAQRSLLDFLTDDRTLLDDAERLLAELRLRESGFQGLKNLVGDSGIISFFGSASGYLQSVFAGGNIFLVRNSTARLLTSLAVLRTCSTSGLCCESTFKTIFSPPVNSTPKTSLPAVNAVADADNDQ